METSDSVIEWCKANGRSYRILTRAQLDAIKGGASIHDVAPITPSNVIAVEDSLIRVVSDTGALSMGYVYLGTNGASSSVTVNGVLVDSSNYIVENGAVTFTDAFLATLGVGYHTFELFFDYDSVSCEVLLQIDDERINAYLVVDTLLRGTNDVIRGSYSE